MKQSLQQAKKSCPFADYVESINNAHFDLTSFRLPAISVSKGNSQKLLSKLLKLDASPQDYQEVSTEEIRSNMGQQLSAIRVRTLPSDYQPNYCHFKLNQSIQRQRSVHKVRQQLRNQELITQVQKSRASNKTKLQSNDRLSTETIISKYIRDLQSFRQIQKSKDHEQITKLQNVESVYQNLLTDPKLSGKISLCTPLLKQLIYHFLDPQEILPIAKKFDLQRLQLLHSAVQVKRIHFVRFKYHLIAKMIDLNFSAHDFQRVCQQIQLLGPHLLNEKKELDIFGRTHGLSSCTQSLYDKLFADYSIRHHFKNVNLTTLQGKLAKFLFQLVQQMDSPYFTREMIRNKHKHLALTHVQYTNFKLYLSKALGEIDVPIEYRKKILKQIDMFKHDVINRESLKDVIRRFGFAKLIDVFMTNSMADQVLHELITERGFLRFKAHAANMFHYLIFHDDMSLTSHDIEQIHCLNSKEKHFKQMQLRALQCLGLATKDQQLLDEFKEQWEEVKVLVVGQRQASLLEQDGGAKKIHEWAVLLEREFSQRQLNQYFEAEDTNMLGQIKMILHMLVYPEKFYKRQDLKGIHKRFNITEAIFQDFYQAFQTVFDELPQFKYVLDGIQSYKEVIVSSSS